MIPKLSFVLLSVLIASISAATTNGEKSQQFYLDGKKLPADFLYGCGTSAYQIEGAYSEGGKGPSVWDTFAHDTGKGHIAGDVNGDVAMDFYHTYPEDLPLFKSALGVNLYDFTISWTRWFPNGTGTEPLEDGVRFYKDMIKKTHDNNMLASCTLYHWDLPQALEDKYNGWLSPNVVTDFTAYANTVYDKLGKDCDIWVTMNEPRTFCTEGYGPDTDSAPGRDGPIDDNYVCMHHALLSHANAVKAFNEKKKAGVVKGKIGIKLDGSPAFALNSSDPASKELISRANDFEMGWDAGPIYSGDYPQVMRDTMGDHLPTFTDDEKKLLKESGSDFLAYDAYTSQWVAPLDSSEKCDYGDDAWPTCLNSYSQDPVTQKLIGRPTNSPWNFQANDTIFSGSKYFVERWGVKDIRVGENGMAALNDSQLPMNQIVDDVDRIDWYRQALKNVQWGLDYGLPITGWIPWSCISNLEWSSGYVNDFGLIHTLPGKNQTRTPKKSTAYMKGVFLKGAPIDPYNFD